jgi:two-component system phosphate regulon response regulator PhoB
MAPLVLVVDDERDLVRTLEYNLEKAGFATRSAETGAEALERAFETPVPDLILLDLMLPDMPGTDVCKRLRADRRTAGIAIVMLTAKDEEIDRVVGFEVGADDYVVKPFSVRELLLRVRAVLRRSQAPTAPESAEGIVTFGRLRIDAGAHRVWVDEEEVMLTALELRLVSLLLQRKGRVQSRGQLLDDVWGIQAELTTRTVDTHVKRLRQKLGAAGTYVETVRGVGYRFRDTPQGGNA